jgi:hypothetical protein
MTPGVVITLAICATAIVMGLIIHISAHAKLRRDAATKLRNVPPDVSSRLERMEQSIDAVALEMERISEGQRFTTKLLSDMSDARRDKLSAGAQPRPSGP